MPAQHTAIIRGYWNAKNFHKAEGLITEHIDTFGSTRFAMQCNLIKLWLQQQRPQHALHYMQQINPAFLSDDERKKLDQLSAVAQGQIQAGMIELQ